MSKRAKHDKNKNIPTDSYSCSAGYGKAETENSVHHDISTKTHHPDKPDIKY